jgi:hypothetical protein
LTKTLPSIKSIKKFLTSFNHSGSIKSKLTFMVYFGTPTSSVVSGNLKKNIYNYMSLAWFVYYYEVLLCKQ